MKSLLFRNVSVVSSNGSRVADVFCESGRISRIGVGIDVVGDRIIDGSGLHLLPGVIDPHVHFRDPGLTHKEDFHSGSIAAVSGGVTTVFDMPNTVPPTYLIDQLEAKRQIAREKSVCNFGFYMGSDGENLDEISRSDNIAGVKVVMNDTPAGRNVSNSVVLERIFSLHGKRFTLHAEGIMFERAVSFLEKQQSPIVHLAHISSRREIEQVRELKKRGFNVTCEVTPHHLFFNSDDLPGLGNFGLMKPQLGSSDDQKSLWEGIADGTIDMIATDHAPHTFVEKESIDESFAYGVPGVENSLKLMMKAVNEDRLSLEKLVWLMCECPAKVFGLLSKGKIGEGMDADLVLIDLNRKETIENSRQRTKCGWTPYSGIQIQGVPMMTLVGGEIAFENGRVFDEVRGSEVVFG